MKITYRLPTRDQYGYVEIEIEKENPTPTEVMETYEELMAEVRKDKSLSSREFNTFVDNYLTGGTITTDEYDSMSNGQKEIIQVIKRSKARTKDKMISSTTPPINEAVEGK